MEQKSRVFKVTLYLFYIYLILELVHNFIVSFFTYSDGLFGLFGKNDGFDLFNLINFIVMTFPLVLIYRLLKKVMQFSKYGHFILILLFILSIPGFFIGLYYDLNMFLYFFPSMRSTLPSFENLVLTNTTVLRWIFIRGDLQPNGILVFWLWVIGSIIVSIVELLLPAFILLTIRSYKSLRK